MKNEITEYLNKNKNNLQKISEDIKNIISNKFSSTNPDTLVFMGFLEYSINEKIINNVLEYINDNIDNEISNLLRQISIDEKEGFLQVYKKIKNEFDKYEISLVDIEWKFIGLYDINACDMRDMDPKILLKLIFSNNSYKIIETNYSNFKKMQEEIEENILSFNFVYTKRLINFSK